MGPHMPSASLGDYDQQDGHQTPSQGGGGNTSCREAVDNIDASMGRRHPPANKRAAHESIDQGGVDQNGIDDTIEPHETKRHRADILIYSHSPLRHNPPLHSFLDIASVARINSWLDNIVGVLDSPEYPLLRYCHSAPPILAMELNDGQAMSPTPSPHAPALASQPTVSRGASDTAQSGPGYSRTTRASETSQPLKKNGTGHYNYRFKNLVAANIEYTFDMGDELPSAVYGLVKTIQLDRSSPGPTLEDTSGDLDRRIIAVEADEAEVKSFYCTNVFRNPQQEILQKTETHVLEKHAVPGPTQPAVAICTPTPDLIYGYNRRLAFSASQKTQLPENTAANSRGLTLPFLVVEFKGVDGNLWAAENQCLGGSSSCVLIAECFNDELDICTEGSVPKFDTTIFSIAMSGSEARLYVSWKQDDQKYCMALVKAFLLCEPDHYIQFRKHVRNIFDWGLGERLTDIRRCLDSMN